MRIVYNVIYRYAIRLKFGDKFLSFLPKLVLKIPGTFFLHNPFSNIKKGYLRISKYLAQFISFSNVKYLQISKYTFHTSDHNNNNNF